MVIERSKVNEQKLKNFLVTLQHHPFPARHNCFNHLSP